MSPPPQHPLKFTTPPTLPPNTVILITGVNGLLASHIADQCLHAGYRVRGTVRSAPRHTWLTRLFTSRYGANRFELIEVPDLTALNIWTEPLRGVGGVVSVAGHAGLMVGDGEEFEKGVEGERMVWRGLLEGARDSNLNGKGGEGEGVKVVVFTSSVWAAWTPRAGVVKEVGEWDWNEEALGVTGDGSVRREEKGIAPFMALKARVEQEVWEWVEREKPGFRFNVILPDTVIGGLLDAENQPGSTSGMVGWVYRGDNLGVLNSIEPQWFIGARDNARLYVAALAMGEVDRWRVFGCAERFNWKMVLDVLKRIYPERPEGEWIEMEDPQLDLSEIKSDKGLRLLRYLGQEEWTGFEESVRELAESAKLGG